MFSENFRTAMEKPLAPRLHEQDLSHGLNSTRNVWLLAKSSPDAHYLINHYREQSKMILIDGFEFTKSLTGSSYIIKGPTIDEKHTWTEMEKIISSRFSPTLKILYVNIRSILSLGIISVAQNSINNAFPFKYE